MMRNTLRMMLVPGLLAGVLALPSAAWGHPEACGKETDEHAHESAEICLTDEEIAGFDDSGANLMPGQVGRSQNMHLVANLPKMWPFETEGDFNSDIAFQDDYAYQGNYDGIQVTNIADPANPQRAGFIHCPGSQNDVSVYGDLMFTSTDSSRKFAECSRDGELNPPQSAAIASSWEGIRIFDISNPANPTYLDAVETDCGSHTHTLVPDLDDDRLLLYVSSYGPNAAFPDCQPPHDKISIVEVPLDDPASASVIAEPVLFPDGGFPGAPGRSATAGCHDITVYQAIGLAAGACMGEGILMDISDPADPQVLSSVTDPNFAFWHSATFFNDGSKVLFTDELGGGGGPTCNPTVGPVRGADAIYDISDPANPEFLSYFKIPRTQSNTENCVAHNGMFLPTERRDVYVQAWYQGGTSIVDMTDASNPKEIGFFDRGPLSNDRLILGGAWSSYWYNGKIYANDIQMGLDVLNFSGKEKAPAGFKTNRLNAQTQEPVS